MDSPDYMHGHIDDQIERARAALSIEGVSIVDAVSSLVRSGIAEEDAFLAVSAAELSIKWENIIDKELNRS